MDSCTLNWATRLETHALSLPLSLSDADNRIELNK